MLIYVFELYLSIAFYNVDWVIVLSLDIMTCMQYVVVT